MLIRNRISEPKATYSLGKQSISDLAQLEENHDLDSDTVNNKSLVCVFSQEKKSNGA